MELEKRKREDNGGDNGKRVKLPEDDDGVKGVVPEDEEVEEFFAILKRIRVAVKYFRERNNRRCIGRELTATAPWSPSFEREDFGGVKKESEVSEGSHAGLDLNSDPVSDVSDSAA